MIADALPVLISQVDKNGCYRFNNLAYEKWFGQSSDHIAGHHMRDVLGEAVWERIRPIGPRVKLIYLTMNQDPDLAAEAFVCQ